MAQAFEYVNQTTDYDLAQDFRTALNFLKGLDSVQPSRIGVVGYCIGGLPQHGRTRDSRLLRLGPGGDGDHTSEATAANGHGPVASRLYVELIRRPGPEPIT